MSITLSPHTQAQLEAVAKGLGLPPEDALDQIIADARAASDASSISDIRPVPIWKRAAALGAAIPADERARMPHDGSLHYEKYLYGTPNAEG